MIFNVTADPTQRTVLEHRMRWAPVFVCSQRSTQKCQQALCLGGRIVGDFYFLPIFLYFLNFLQWVRPKINMFFKNKVCQCIIKFQTAGVLRRRGRQGSAPWSLGFENWLRVCSEDPFTYFILVFLYHISPCISCPSCLQVTALESQGHIPLSWPQGHCCLWSRTYPTAVSGGSLFMAPSRASLMCCGQAVHWVLSDPCAFAKTLQLPLGSMVLGWSLRPVYVETDLLHTAFLQ